MIDSGLGLGSSHWNLFLGKSSASTVDYEKRILYYFLY